MKADPSLTGANGCTAFDLATLVDDQVIFNDFRYGSPGLLSGKVNVATLASLESGNLAL